MRQSPINALLLHPCLAAQSRGKGLEEYFCLLLVCPDVFFPEAVGSQLQEFFHLAWQARWVRERAPDSSPHVCQHFHYLLEWSSVHSQQHPCDLQAAPGVGTFIMTVLSLN